MSRIGRKPIVVPSGVKVEVAGRTVTVTGPKGTLKRDLPGSIAVAVGGDSTGTVDDGLTQSTAGVGIGQLHDETSIYVDVRSRVIFKNVGTGRFDRHAFFAALNREANGHEHNR